MKNYIANERVNIMTSALHVRRLFTKCIELGRRYSQSNRKEDLYEALRLMGTGLHCLEGKLPPPPFFPPHDAQRNRGEVQDVDILARFLGA